MSVSNKIFQNLLLGSFPLVNLFVQIGFFFLFEQLNVFQ